MKIVIVGGVAGGMSAATRLRRLVDSAEIVVIERSGHVSFANCGLPYHVGGVIKDRDDLLLQTPESLAARFALDVRVRHEVVGIDPMAQTVEVRDIEHDRMYTEHYDSLVLSPGARPVRPPIPGIERALTLRDIEDTDAMIAALDDKVDKVGTAVIIGGGFIGLEMAENLVHRGLRVTLVEATDQVMAPLDPEMVGPVQDRMRAQGDYEKERAAFIARQTMGRLGTPEDIAAVAVFLARDESALMTGTALAVDGCWTNT